MHCTHRFVIAFAITPVAFSQDITPLVLEGDVTSIGAVTRIDNMAILNSATWLVEVDTDAVDTSADGALLDANGVLLQEGQALPAPAGATLDSFDSVNIATFGRRAHNFFLDGTSGSSDDSGIYLGNSLLIQESDVSTSPGLTPGTPYIGFFDVKAQYPAGGLTHLMVVASTDDAAITSSVDQVLMHIEVDSGGFLLAENVIAKEGDLLPGQSEPIATFGTGPHNSAYAGPGRELFFADLSGDTSTDGVIYLNTTLLAQEGSPSPVAGRNWSSLSSPELDVNTAGDHVYSGSLEGDSGSNLVIIMNGAVLAQEGSGPADIAPFSITSFGSGPISLADTGDVLWYADWDDPDTDVDTGLFLNDELLVQEGMALLGSTIDTLRGVQDGYFLSDSGQYVLFEAILADGREGAFMIELTLGENFCSVNPSGENGVPAILSARGSTSIADGDFTLVCDSVNVQPGLFFFGPDQILVPFGNGFRCVGGQVVRLPVLFPATGSVEFPVDLGFYGVTPGTVNFQFWFRDTVGVSTFNLSDGLSVLFVP